MYYTFSNFPVQKYSVCIFERKKKKQWEGNSKEGILKINKRIVSSIETKVRYNANYFAIQRQRDNFILSLEFPRFTQILHKTPYKMPKHLTPLTDSPIRSNHDPRRLAEEKSFPLFLSPISKSP